MSDFTTVEVDSIFAGYEHERLLMDLEEDSELAMASEMMSGFEVNHLKDVRDNFDRHLDRMIFGARL